MRIHILTAHNANSVRMARPGKHNHWVQLNCYLWRILCFIIISRVLFRSIGVRGILHNAHTHRRFAVSIANGSGQQVPVAVQRVKNLNDRLRLRRRRRHRMTTLLLMLCLSFSRYYDVVVALVTTNKINS